MTFLNLHDEFIKDSLINYLEKIVNILGSKTDIHQYYLNDPLSIHDLLNSLCIGLEAVYLNKIIYVPHNTNLINISPWPLIKLFINGKDTKSLCNAWMKEIFTYAINFDNINLLNDLHSLENTNDITLFDLENIISDISLSKMWIRHIVNDFKYLESFTTFPTLCDADLLKSLYLKDAFVLDAYRYNKFLAIIQKILSLTINTKLPLLHSSIYYDPKKIDRFSTAALIVSGYRFDQNVENSHEKTAENAFDDDAIPEGIEIDEDYKLECRVYNGKSQDTGEYIEPNSNTLNNRLILNPNEVEISECPKVHGPEKKFSEADFLKWYEQFSSKIDPPKSEIYYKNEKASDLDAKSFLQDFSDKNSTKNETFVSSEQKDDIVHNLTHEINQIDVHSTFTTTNLSSEIKVVSNNLFDNILNDATHETITFKPSPHVTEENNIITPEFQNNFLEKSAQTEKTLLASKPSSIESTVTSDSFDESHIVYAFDPRKDEFIKRRHKLAYHVIMTNLKTMKKVAIINESDIKLFLGLYDFIQIEKGLDLQDNVCASSLCRKFIDYGDDYRVCHYDGFYYCMACHKDESSIIPSRALLNWDFKLYKVCCKHKEILDVTRIHPINQLHDKIIASIPLLNQIQRARRALRLFYFTYLVHCSYESSRVFLRHPDLNRHVTHNMMATRFPAFSSKSRKSSPFYLFSDIDDINMHLSEFYSLQEMEGYLRYREDRISYHSKLYDFIIICSNHISKLCDHCVSGRLRCIDCKTQTITYSQYVENIENPKQPLKSSLFYVPCTINNVQQSLPTSSTKKKSKNSKKLKEQKREKIANYFMTFMLEPKCLTCYWSQHVAENHSDDI